ncbi:endocuticle structural glycoprotein SgAbd-1-like [Leptopilina heterotoma]|uniref:endocuticle structural glycoprotein SgAbd-1-like n=1 Tax=Leptopilina heterotoma TaxID=63436 RepID=UPI001CA97638|nr:endocuticle structural glycoprotein SgAbd-1-like [Leptopilina heterotoma]
MKFLIASVISALVVLAAAAPIDDKPEPIAILRSSADGPNPDGSYAYSYETENGIKAEERGELRQIGEESGIAAQGSYSYTADDGSPISLTYTADENGFQPQGDHLPKSPEVPAAILRALEWIAAHPEEDQLTK